MPDPAGERDEYPIERGFPISEVSALAEREGRAKLHYRPLTTMHKWWATQLGSVFRAISLYTLLDDPKRVSIDDRLAGDISLSEFGDETSTESTDVRALAEDVETEVAKTAGNLTTKVGDGGSNITLQDILDARKELSSKKVPQSQRFLPLDPAQYNVLLSENNIAFSNRYGDNSAIQQGQFGTVYGFNAVDWNYAQTNTSPSPNELNNLALHRDALTFVNRPLPVDGVGVDQSRADYQNLSLRVTMSYSHEYLGWMVTLDILYGVSVLRDDHGVILATQTS